MKKNKLKPILYVLLLAALLSIFVFTLFLIVSDNFLCVPVQTGSDETSSSDGTHNPPYGITANELTISDGTSVTLECYLPEDTPCAWISSDETVVSCNGAVITAHCAGEASITVTGSTFEDHIAISVVDTAADDAAKLLATLADTGEDLSTVYAMADRLSLCTGADAGYMNELFSLLTACANGNACTDETIINTAANAGIDAKVLLDAASYCWSAGQAKQHSAVISFTGDVTIGQCNEKITGLDFKSVYNAQDSLTYPFDGVKRFFLTDDLTVINFEGVLTDSKKYADKAFYFRGEPSYAAIFPASGIDAANLANNHSMDYFEKGREDTNLYLNEAGLITFNQGAPAEYTITCDDGHTVRIVLFAYNLTGGSYSTPDAESLELMAEYKKDPDTIVIASAHWGKEYSQYPMYDQASFGRNLAEGSADLIIGHHPHIVQGIEYYNGKYIAYSLGNFAFGGNEQASYPQTFILQAYIDYIDGRATVSGISVIPCHTTSTGTTENNYQPCVQYGSKAEKVMNIILSRSRRVDNGVNELLWSGI